jgi:hypothetical protein
MRLQSACFLWYIEGGRRQMNYDSVARARLSSPLLVWLASYRPPCEIIKLVSGTARITVHGEYRQLRA